MKNESILNELSNLKEVSEKSILSEILTRDEKSSDVRINYRAYLNPSSQKATSNATLTDELQKQPISNLEDCRSHSAQSLTICTKERTPSNTLNTRTLELFQEKLNKGEIDVIAQDLFKNYLTIPKDDIFESKIKSTITISTLHQIIQDLLIDSLKNREQLERLKPSRLIHDAKSSLTTNGIVDALL